MFRPVGSKVLPNRSFYYEKTQLDCNIKCSIHTKMMRYLSDQLNRKTPQFELCVLDCVCFRRALLA